MTNTLSLILGGVRSGKSAFAESLAFGSSGGEGKAVWYVATGRAGDSAMTERIRRHRERRPAHWQTLEEPLNLADALEDALTKSDPPQAVLIDSIDSWVANLLLQGMEPDAEVLEELALEQLERLLRVCREGRSKYILVSSEVGLSPVSATPLGRQFQDLLGTVNQRAAAAADAVYLVVAGIPTPLKTLAGPSLNLPEE